MKTYKLNHRYNAQKKWGFTYSVEFSDREWQRFYALKSIADKLFGDSTETVMRYVWRVDAELLKSAPWAYHYDRMNKPTFVYFRTQDDMERALLLLALTA
jgi:hypothetical protein